MKKLLFLIIFFSFIISLKIFNDEYAITDSGKKVLLHDNGTWEYYVEKKIEIKEEIKEIEEIEITKSENVKADIRGNRKTYTIWYDNNKWTNSKLKSNSNNIEYEFFNMDKSIYASMISEKTKIPVDTLKELVLFNAKKEGVNVQLLESNYRNVNNSKLLFMKYSVILDGFSHIFCGYIFSNDKGSYQFFTKIRAEFFSEKKTDIEELINGLVIN